MVSFLKKLDPFFFPKLCIHCQATLEKTSSIFCEDCQANICFAEPDELCRWCSRERDLSSLLCSECHTRKSEKRVFPSRMVTVCTKTAQVKTLIALFEKRRWLFLSRTIASMMAVRWIEDVDVPIDLIVYQPRFFLLKHLLGFHPEKQVAKHLSFLLKRPHKDLLGLFAYPRPDRPLQYDEIKVRIPLWHQSVLLIALEKKDGEELALYAKRLLAFGAKKVHILTLM